MQKNLIKCALPAVVIIAGVLWYLLSNEVVSDNGKRGTVIELRQEDDISGEEKTVGRNESAESTAESKGQPESETTIQVFINVHVCGAVLNPGVYRLPEGARVIHAIEAAGGVSAGAAGDYLNLASLVRDGTRIYVPTRTEVEAGFSETVSYVGEEDSTESTKININTATKEELVKLPGIGEGKAESIISYREENGGFKSIEDIMLIGGIKEAIFNRIKDYIKVQN